MDATQAAIGANKYYDVLLKVEIGGTEFSIYGSMSWTVSQTKKHEWEQLRAAYVELTGDTREDVNRDDAANVIAGELQLSWAQATGRDDLIPKLKENQERRVDMALKTTEATNPGARRGAPTRAKPAPRTRIMADGTEEVVEGAEAPAAGGSKKFTRGSMGTAARLMDEGVTDEDEVVAQVEAEHPTVKNVRRHIRYVAREKGVTLTKAAAAEPAEAAAE